MEINFTASVDYRRFKKYEENLLLWATRVILDMKFVVVQRDVSENLEALNVLFTTDMEQWQIEWETPYW